MNKTSFFVGFASGLLAPVAILVVAGLMRFGGGRDIVIVNESQIGIPKIEMGDIVVVDLNNKPIKLSDYKDDVILVDFWATWCSPCLEGFPYYEHLQKTENVRVVAISDQKISTIQRFRRKNNYSFTFLKSLPKLNDYNITAIPLSLLFYKDSAGYTKVENPDSLKIKSILDLLKSRALPHRS